MAIKPLSKSYDRTYVRQQVRFSDIPKSFPTARNHALFKLAGSGQRVLEIGPGDANVLYNLRNSFEELYGVEISQGRATKANEALAANNVSNITVIAGNIESGIDLPDNFFDVIIWADVVEHVVDLWATMAEVSRLLKPGGKLVTCTPNIASWRYRLTLLFGKFPGTSARNEGFAVREGELYDGGHLHYFTFSSLEKLYRKYNVKPVKRMGFGKLGKLHNLYPPLLSGAVCIVGINSKL
ncbi:class I SAM-dependent methyltransferase [filamentous cyanobacterium LEGE 11480]|uniref:Class I SAM-dependent methyltransferase n=1 Tax=Romeriopsis navalis LEGE 11480 TaxID=2777977 RepID=A0A928Z389_9CYAN|nr:class I SAM-dependent methyltransferase [Romeriopsis navalis]MBE9031261.1 class I SAM-dependent methyltransferase [Romeriopsis navalis LEGE 11480]